MRNLNILWWQWRFRRYRVEYLHYLSTLLGHLSGQQTIKRVFSKEMQRYGLAHVRGRLAQLWLQRLAQQGGDLALAWQGCFPAEVLQIVRVSQQYGSRSLVSALTIMAQQQEALEKIKRQSYGVLWPAFFALLLLSVALVLVPVFTVPELQQAFAHVPEEYYGSSTRALFASAQWLSRFGWLIPVGGALFITLVVYSMRNLTGPIRALLERCEPWKSYRLLGSFRLLQMLHILLGLSHLRLPLKEAVHALTDTANPWFRAHIARIKQHIVHGRVGAESFATGLFDEEDLWFLVDMAEGHSLAQACELTAQRVAQRLERRSLALAVLLRWLLLLVGVLLLAGLLLWHYQAFEELRQGLMHVYA